MFNRKITSEQAILIEKKILKITKKPNEVRNVIRMKYGIYDSLNETKKKANLEYKFVFMTKKGKKTFKIDASIYHQIKVDSLGLLNRKSSSFLSFEFDKIANKSDIIKLDW